MKKIILVVALVTALLGVLYATGITAPVNQTATGEFREHRVKVFFADADDSSTDCSVVNAYTRGTIGPDVLHDAMNQLLRGPRAREEGNGARSLFSHRTSGLVNKVRINSGVAYVDFDDFRHIIPDASASCASTSLLKQLNRTAKQFPSVDSVRYSFEGNRAAFYEWLQMSPP